MECEVEGNEWEPVSAGVRWAKTRLAWTIDPTCTTHPMQLRHAQVATRTCLAWRRSPGTYRTGSVQPRPSFRRYAVGWNAIGLISVHVCLEVVNVHDSLCLLLHGFGCVHGLGFRRLPALLRGCRDARVLVRHGVVRRLWTVCVLLPGSFVRMVAVLPTRSDKKRCTWLFAIHVWSHPRSKPHVVGHETKPWWNRRRRDPRRGTTSLEASIGLDGAPCGLEHAGKRRASTARGWEGETCRRDRSKTDPDESTTRPHQRRRIRQTNERTNERACTLACQRTYDETA